MNRSFIPTAARMPLRHAKACATLRYSDFMTFDLSGRTALVTGAGRGIGRAVATQLAGFGASVIANDLDADVVNETASLIAKSGGAARAVAGDLTASGAPERLVESALKAFGSIDIIVNNAGYTWD